MGSGKHTDQTGDVSCQAISPILWGLGSWARCSSVDVRSVRRTHHRQSGGDEETRTPDPLLAKEMLCQLSYVPAAAEWWAFLDSNQRPLPYQGSALTS